jgi:hypothetical protein
MVPLVLPELIVPAYLAKLAARRKRLGATLGAGQDESPQFDYKLIVTVAEMSNN